MAVIGEFFATASVTGAWSQRLATVISLLVMLLIARQLALTTWLLWPQPPALAAPSREQIGVDVRGDSGPSVSEQLRALSPFGRAEIRKKVAPVKMEVPETRLDLTLRGVIAGAGGKFGGAIIADRENGERFVAVGAKIAGAAVLDEVYPQHVVLLRNGRQEVLKMERESIDRSASVKPQSLLEMKLPDFGFPGQPGGLPQSLTDLQRGRTVGMKAVLRIRPLMRGGKIRGFRVTPGRDRKAFAKLGFKAGDLLQSINGTKPQDAREIFGVLDELQNTGSVTVEVTRRGKPVTLSLGGR